MYIGCNIFLARKANEKAIPKNVVSRAAGKTTKEGAFRLNDQKARDFKKWSAVFILV
jgi:hypothetical protein